MKELLVYTDGSCRNNGKKNSSGGMGIHFPNKELEDFSRPYLKGTATNQNTELLAILLAIKYIEKHLPLDEYAIIIYTDSKYSIDCVTKWVNGWKKNGWLTKCGTPVKNKKYIERIHRYISQNSIELRHVPAHTRGSDKGSVANDAADVLAKRGGRRAVRAYDLDKNADNIEILLIE